MNTRQSCYDTAYERAERETKYCRAGHPLTPDNVYEDGRGGVTCRICKRVGAKKSQPAMVAYQMYMWNWRTQRANK